MSDPAHEILATLVKILYDAPCFAGPFPAVWTDKIIAQLRNKGVPDLVIPALLEAAESAGYQFTPTATSNRLEMQAAMAFPDMTVREPQTSMSAITKDEEERAKNYIPPQISYALYTGQLSQGRLLSWGMKPLLQAWWQQWARQGEMEGE